MNKYISNLVLTSTLSWILVPLVYAKGALLPMEYYTPTYPIKSMGSRVLMGTEPEIDGSGQFSINSSRVIFVAPHSSRVSASKLTQYITANCGAVQNELEIETLTSDMILNISKEIKYWGDELAKDRLELVKAAESCLQAKKDGAKDLSSCDYRKELASIIRETAEMISPWQKMIADIAEQSNLRLDAMGLTPGGYVAVNANLYDSDELEKVRRANPGYDVRVVPFSEVFFNFEPAADDINARLNRRTTLGYSMLGESNLQPSVKGSDEASSRLQSGSTVSLGVTLSRIGACQKEFLRTGTFVYKFPTYGFLQGSAVYNKWRVYEKFEENTSKGGFLTTSSVHKLYEDMKAGREFQFSVVTDGEIDAEEMKERIQARLLGQLVEEFLDITLVKREGEPSALPNPGQNGADVAGDALVKNCPHVYCQAGGFALKTLSAAFGGAKSREEIKQSLNIKVEEKWGYTTRYSGYDSSSTIIDVPNGSL